MLLEWRYYPAALTENITAHLFLTQPPCSGRGEGGRDRGDEGMDREELEKSTKRESEKRGRESGGERGRKRKIGRAHV